VVLTQPLPTRRALLGLALMACTVRAADWPVRPIRWTVAYPPGGVSDEVSRAIADRLAAALGVPVLVDHRPGAGGALAMEQLARAAPDGHHLCFSAISALTQRTEPGRVGIDPERDIAPVIAVMATPVLVVGTRALAATSFRDVLALARLQPGRLRWASSGLGTTGHTVLEQVRRTSGVDIVHVPYKGGGQQLADALGGQFELLSSNVAAGPLGYIRDGRLKPLAVGAPARLGFEAANRVSLFGVFAPGATPPALIERLNSAIARVLALPAIRQRLLAVDNLPAGGSAAHFRQQIAAELRANQALFAPR
jgi:tripartite-type tricarboxylate transporter receptor subunit TctC